MSATTSSKNSRPSPVSPLSPLTLDDRPDTCFRKNSSFAPATPTNQAQPTSSQAATLTETPSRVARNTLEHSLDLNEDDADGGVLLSPRTLRVFPDLPILVEDNSGFPSHTQFPIIYVDNIVMGPNHQPKDSLEFFKRKTPSSPTAPDDEAKSVASTSDNSSPVCEENSLDWGDTKFNLSMTEASEQQLAMNTNANSAGSLYGAEEIDPPPSFSTVSASSSPRSDDEGSEIKAAERSDTGISGSASPGQVLNREIAELDADMKANLNKITIRIDKMIGRLRQQEVDIADVLAEQLREELSKEQLNWLKDPEWDEKKHQEFFPKSSKAN